MTQSGAAGRGITRGWQGGHNYPGAQSLRWVRNDCERCWKVQRMWQVLSSIQQITSDQYQIPIWGRQTCFLPQTPSNLITPLAAGSTVCFLQTIWYC